MDLIAGKYVLDEQIGRGAMGLVYRAHNIETAETVAIKMLDPHLVDDLPELWVMKSAIPVAIMFPFVFYVFFPNRLVFTPISIAGSIVFLFITAVVNYAINDGLSADELGRRVQANDGMRASALNAILSAVLFALFAAFYVTTCLLILNLDIASSFLYGTAFGVLMIGDTLLSHGGTPVIQHIILRWQLQRQKAIPQQLVSLLDYAADLILLRKVGGGYIFVHRYLLEYFANLDTHTEKP